MDPEPVPDEELDPAPDAPRTAELGSIVGVAARFAEVCRCGGQSSPWCVLVIDGQPRAKITLSYGVVVHTAWP